MINKSFREFTKNKKSLKINDELTIYKLLFELKKIEGCNKKIMKLIMYYQRQIMVLILFHP